jgi:hypothetical protein
MEKYSLEWKTCSREGTAFGENLSARARTIRTSRGLRPTSKAQFESLRPTLAAADETLSGALDTARQKVLHQLDSLHGKYVHAVARRNETLERHLDAMCNSLFPRRSSRSAFSTSVLSLPAMALNPYLAF